MFNPVDPATVNARSSPIAASSRFLVASGSAPSRGWASITAVRTSLDPTPAGALGFTSSSASSKPIGSSPLNGEVRPVGCASGSIFFSTLPKRATATGASATGAAAAGAAAFGAAAALGSEGAAPFPSPPVLKRDG